MRRALCLAAVVLVSSGGSAQAQTAGRPAQRSQPARPPRPAAPPLPGPERLRIVVNAGALIAAGSFGQDFVLTKNVEPTPVTTELALGSGGSFDAGARIRITRALSVGAVGFVSASRAGGTLDARIPHPFYYNQPRAIAGELSGLRRTERGVHIELAYPVSVARGREITVFGGPSYINTRQALVTEVEHSDSYPFDSATYTSATTSQVTKGAAGMHAGADITWRLSRSFRAGALLRYSYANLSLDAGRGNTVALHAGGFQIAGGIRILIQRGPPTGRRPAALPGRR